MTTCAQASLKKNEAEQEDACDSQNRKLHAPVVALPL